MIRLTLTPKAIERLLAIRPGSFVALDPLIALLRIKVTGGGCSGLQYKMEWVEYLESNDSYLECDGLTVAMDEKTAMLTFGMTIDYDDGLNGKGFEYINPNAKRSCGCGESFSV